MSLTSILSTAKTLMKRGQYAAAYKLYLEVLDSYPSNPDALAAIASIEAQQLDKDVVPLEIINKVLNLYNQKKFSDALGLVSDYEGNYRKDITLLNIKGAILSSEGQFSKALECFVESTVIKPDHDQGYSNQGLALFKLGRSEEAQKAFEKSLSINPTNAGAHNNMGVLLEHQNKLAEAKKSFKKAVKLKEDYYEAYINLGNVLLKQNLPIDAANIYHEAVKINPDLFEGHVMFGNVLKEMGRFSDALDSYKKALAIDPQAGYVAHLVNALSGTTTQSAPKSYISKVFDEYADHFEHHLVYVLQYKTPSILKKYFDQCDELNNKKFDRAVDLGCGTGLAGISFRNSVKYLLGIDLSSKMLDMAKEKNIYDSLVQGDIIEVLEAQNVNYDLFLCSDTFIYVGNLTQLFKTVSDKSNSNALFIFSTEHLEEGDFVLRKTGRYAQSYSYVMRLAQNNGFRLVRFSKENLRKDPDNWIIGGLYILQK